MTKPQLEAVIDGMVEIITGWNQAAEDGDRGPNNNALVLEIWDDGSGKICEKKTFGDVDTIHEFNNLDDLLEIMKEEGVLEPTNHFTNIQGPQKCPRRCSECSDGNHHWLTVTFPGCLTPEDDDWHECVSHPAVQLWIAQKGRDINLENIDDNVTYLACKHCPAWHLLTEAMMEDSDFDLV